MPSLREALRQVRRTALLMVGVPDYDVYLAHRRAAHPGEPAMTRSEFHRDRLEKRYSPGASRCC